ncbi:hypothetical protein P4C99_21730 [Pontiellaceae bacterium B1224]|nr:hypothetical protein [Pontiellaceae bacterium B1224]
MVEPWISDTCYPVVTEINLDAVRQNNNQFYTSVSKKENWITTCTDNELGFLRYKVLTQDSNSYTIEFQSNEGGSLTTSSIISFRIIQRSLKIDGKEKQIEVLQVTKIKASNQNMELTVKTPVD